ncbi:MAG: double-strand break repair protein AddB [Proteobacteria bacterium]|nr:double-strand break repair protein AddB [Pseudomonadota bacterium]
MAGRVYTIPPSAPFADSLARGLIRQHGENPLALADITIYLPTRRAQRTFGDAFARALGGAALLPRFKALGDADEDELMFDDDALDIPPAISPMRRTLLLASLVRRWAQTGGEAPMPFAQAVALAESLGQVMDEVATHGADLSLLESFVPTALAAHWEQVRKFLVLIEEQWPALLAAEGCIGHSDRRDRILRGLADRLRRTPPAGPVIAAGSTGSIPATAELMRAILDLPLGSIVLPGLDLSLDEASWTSLDPGHPQYGMRQLLLRLDVRREGVAVWEEVGDVPRETLIREVLRPAPTTDAWRAIAESDQTHALRSSLSGLSLAEAPDPAAEALVIALALREAIEEPGKTAALVTPDRALARRVVSELTRWDIEVDDSAGQPLAHTPAGTFLCLLAEAAEAAFAPIPLLALLKHPLCRPGESRTAFLAQVRNLDLVLRGPRPDDGVAGILRTIGQSKEAPADLPKWFAALTKILEPLETVFRLKDADLGQLMDAHLAAAEALANPALWSGEAGDAAASFVKDLRDAVIQVPPVETGAYAAIFRKLALLRPVRRRRGGHPRVHILGALEARLQRFDVTVLGGLNEGTWPRSAGADPWFSRPMRSLLNLELPERAIGQSAHDFAMLSASPRVILTRSQKVEGAPAIASRWLQRLTQFTQGLRIEDALVPGTDYVALAAALNDAGPPQPEGRPAPRPPVSARPTKASVTEIERWVRDPYSIYARRILGLEVLDPLDAPIGPLERGNAFHKALERFVNELPGELPDDAAHRLMVIADEVFAADGTPREALAVWRPRFMQAAAWFAELERQRRPAIASSHTEVFGKFDIADGFTLYGFADRIDVLKNGSATIIDYKTGSPPGDREIEVFLAPQLPLEGAILAAGGFEGLGRRHTGELLYIRISGGREAGATKTVDATLIDEAAAKLRAHIALFRNPETPYLSRPHAKFAREEGDYDHLARVREWSLSGWEAPEE